MRQAPHITQFLRREDGSLLIFFAVSVITILGIVALSFDLGRRASTQTDMQAYVDNVALAAAGELNGTPGAIVNATAAANSVIAAANENLKSGTAGQEMTLTLQSILFYEDLPDSDQPSGFDTATLASTKYVLPSRTTTDPERARYVGVRLETVDVPWIFAGIFSDLPSGGVGAIAVAGNTAWTCDIAPLLFCLPDDASGDPQQLVPGQGINLRTARQDRRWREGEFGFVDVDIDPTGACAGLTNEAGRQACLITARTRVAACFQPLRADTQPGQRPAQESSAFDMAFDIFDQSMIQFFDDPVYAPGPHSVSGRVPDASGEICAPGDTSTATMAFPLDDCHPSGCIDNRFGDGDWTTGRETYVATNYRVPDTGEPDLEDGSFFDFPEPGLTRYQYYLREIERAANGGEMASRYAGAVYQPDNNGSGEIPPNPDPTTGPFYSTWDDYWDDTPAPGERFIPIIPDARGVLDNGLPQCNRNFSLPPRTDRRVLLAGGIECGGGRDAVVGFEQDVPIVDFYSLFQLGPTTNVTGLPERFDLNVEVIERIAPEDIETTQTVVQLFR
ncbi:MAG: pilus assembly protein TadG-related protein [Paracoccaceae bacterium]